MANDYGKNGNLIVTNTKNSGETTTNKNFLNTVTVGNVGSESAHTHSFSNNATIGSGEYTRPNSISCLYIISY